MKIMTLAFFGFVSVLASTRGKSSNAELAQDKEKRVIARGMSEPARPSTHPSDMNHLTSADASRQVRSLRLGAARDGMGERVVLSQDDTLYPTQWGTAAENEGSIAPPAGSAQTRIAFRFETDFFVHEFPVGFTGVNLVMDQAFGRFVWPQVAIGTRKEIHPRGSTPHCLAWTG